MKVTQEKLPASQVGLEIEIPPELSKQTYEQVIQKFSRSANIPGFRKGKVPRQILIQRLGSLSIKQAVVEELIQYGFQQAIKETEIAAIGNPQLRSSFEELVKQFEPGAPLTVSLTIDVEPEITLRQHQEFQVQAEEVPYDPAKVDNVLEDYRGRVATLVPVEERAAAMGDVAIVDYEGRLSDAESGKDTATAIPGGKAENFQVELNEGRFIAGFVTGIVGMMPGETKEVAVEFPADYTVTQLAGKSVNFTITLKELKQKELPDLDDDFAQEVSEFETLAELRASLEARYQKEATDKTQANKEQALLKALVEQVEVDFPETMVRQETDALITQMAVRLENRGIDVKSLVNAETVSSLRESARPEAIASLKQTLALREIAKLESIEVDEAAVAARFQEVKAQYAGQKFDETRLQAMISDEILADQIMQWLESHSMVELVPLGTLAPQPEPAPSVEEGSAATASEETTAASEETVATAPTETQPETQELDAAVAPPQEQPAAAPKADASTKAAGKSTAKSRKKPKESSQSTEQADSSADT